MSDRWVQEELAGLLEAARPELTEKLEARAVRAVAEATAVRRPLLSRPRWIAVAVGAALALFILGFLPIPMGQTHGALDQAVAALENASGLHLRCHYYDHGRERVVDFWQGGWLMRNDQREGGRLVSQTIYGPDSKVVYDATKKRAEVSDVPPSQATDPALPTLEPGWWPGGSHWWRSGGRGCR